MGPDKGKLSGKAVMMATKAKAKAETNNNQEKNKAARGGPRQTPCRT